MIIFLLITGVTIAITLSVLDLNSPPPVKRRGKKKAFGKAKPKQIWK